ncbi:hypothetical protein GCM10010299_46760 [Streptomyces tanashiensis]|nr:hypothetical protein GCM10010299_46760 [Streptomyces tanashiensis]
MARSDAAPPSVGRSTGWSRIRAADREAFAELYETYARAVYSHALRMTGNWSMAEECRSAGPRR